MHGKRVDLFSVEDLRRPAVIALLAIAFLYPILLCAAAFPTPYIDIRELASWGLNFPLTTWKHPPLQTWVIGGTALFWVRDAWFFMAAAQLCNLLALFYVARIARDFIGSNAVAPVVILVGGSAYLSGSLPTIALNADQLQAPLWAGLIYHAMRAAQDNRWRDWILFAALLALSFLTKYFVAILMVALLVAAVTVPHYRRVFGNIRLYLAGLLAVIFLLPYLIAATQNSGSVGFATTFFLHQQPRFQALYNFLHPILLVLLPVGIAAIWLYPRGLIGINRQANAHVRFLLIAGAAFAIIVLALISIGLNYSQRYSYAFLAISAVLCLGVIRIEASGLPDLTRIMLAIWAVAVPGTFVYAFVDLRPQLREPAPAAAALIGQQWDRSFRCGPAYIMGFKDAAFGVALYFGGPGRRVIGVSTEDYRYGAQWVDRDRIRREGAVLVAYSEVQLAQLFAHDFQEFPKRSAPMTLSLPYRHTWSDARQSYAYVFIAPEGC